MNTPRQSVEVRMNEVHSSISNNSFKASVSQCLAAFSTNILKLTCGSLLGTGTVIIAELYKKNGEIEMSKSQLTWFGSHCFVSPVGSLLMGLLAQNLGNRLILLISSLLFIISLTILYFATSSAMLLYAQAVTGIAICMSVGPGATYVIEITQSHLRSALMASTNLSIIVGSFLAVLYSNWLHWRTIVLVNFIPPVLGFFAIYMIPESPLWLASKGKFEEAENALSWLRGWTKPENTSAEFNLLKETYKIPNGNSTSNRTKSYKTAFKPYFCRSFLLPLASVVCMFILHSCTGYTALLTYSMVIFQFMDSPIDSHKATSIFDAMRIVGAIVCIFCVHYTGKRKLMFISLISAGFSYFLIATLLYLKTQDKYASHTYTFTWIMAVTMIFSTFLTAAGVDKVVFMYNAELFPTNFRNVGVGISLFIYAITGAIVSKSYLYLVDAISLSGTFLFFGIFCFVSCITYYFILPETEGKTLQEVEDYYKRTNNLKHDRALENLLLKIREK